MRPVGGAQPSQELSLWPESESFIADRGPASLPSLSRLWFGSHHTNIYDQLRTHLLPHLQFVHAHGAPEFQVGLDQALVEAQLVQEILQVQVGGIQLGPGYLCLPSGCLPLVCVVPV